MTAILTTVASLSWGVAIAKSDLESDIKALEKDVLKLEAQDKAFQRVLDSRKPIINCAIREIDRIDTQSTQGVVIASRCSLDAPR